MNGTLDDLIKRHVNNEKDRILNSVKKEFDDESKNRSKKSPKNKEKNSTSFNLKDGLYQTKNIQRKKLTKKRIKMYGTTILGCQVM